MREAKNLALSQNKVFSFFIQKYLEQHNGYDVVYIMVIRSKKHHGRHFSAFFF